MKPRRTPDSNGVFRLDGGTEDNDLWVQRATMGSETVIISAWELTDEERKAVAEGANIELCVWGVGTPPVALAVTHVPLGKGGS